MSIASQLNQLQDLDTELEADEQSVVHITRQLADDSDIVKAQAGLDAERAHLADLKKQQRSVETDDADLSSKLNNFEKELYGGRVRNPKELLDLQKEVDALKAKRAQLEEKELGIMEQADTASNIVEKLAAELAALQAGRRERNAQLTTDLEKLKEAITSLKGKREAAAGGIDSEALNVYEQLKKQKGTAVAKVEQGLCRGCRISLPVSKLQEARAGSLVRCGTCGRILYLP